MTMEHQPLTLAELKKNREAVINANVEYKERLSSLEKFAVFVTERVGSMGFFLIIFAWTIIWLAWNTLGPADLRFDPFPSFVLWLFISNMIQIFLMPLIMIGQNLQAKHSERRAEADFQVNIKAEKEAESILMHLENQNSLLLEILKKTK